MNDSIKSIRELKNYTQQHMAQELRMSQAGYSKIEKGSSALSFEKIEAIASIFEMDIKNIIEFDQHLYLGAPIAKKNTVMQQSGAYQLQALYRDKISLLEKLMDITDRELRTYKDRFGNL
ncbi:helix-turn-helix transcriptional regulator [Flavobacterium johnsoniae]|nr:helix-turn-helix transcriptional regulator [Flavobacterium johnsoniae]